MAALRPPPPDRPSRTRRPPLALGACFGRGEPRARRFGRATFSDYPGPVADVQASYQGTSSVFQGTFQGVNTYAIVAFDAAVQPIEDPPEPVSEVPVEIVAPYGVNVSATIAEGSDPASLNATGTVGLWTPAVDLVEKSRSVNVFAGDSAVQEGSLVISGRFPTDPFWGSNVVMVRIRAQCTAGASSSFSIPGSAECQSIIDPIFLFDQDLFDGIMGDDTFTSTDYFEIALSGNLAQPVGVPEPSRFLLLASGLVAVASRCRSGSRRARGRLAPSSPARNAVQASVPVMPLGNRPNALMGRGCVRSKAHQKCGWICFGGIRSTISAWRSGRSDQCSPGR